MSISAISSLTLLNSATSATTSASNAAAAAAAAAAVANSTSAATDSSSTSVSALDKDLVALLKALASNNVSEATALLGKVKADLKAQDAPSTSATDDTTATSSDSSTSLSKLLDTISASLTSGNTDGGLLAMASYLSQGGQSTGNLVDTSA